MKSFINRLKILWNDERGRALIKLGIYLIFITIVGFVLSGFLVALRVILEQRNTVVEF